MIRKFESKSKFFRASVGAFNPILLLSLGETGRRLGDRFRENQCSTGLSNVDLPVGRRFSSSGHTPEDMLVSVINSGFSIALDGCIF